MIDAHAHLAFGDSFAADQAEAIARLRAAGVSAWIEVGTDVAQSRRAIELSARYPDCWASVGVHPSDIGALTETSWEDLALLVRQPRVVAVGEVGFDFYRSSSEAAREPQWGVLARLVELAQANNLPMIFHVRDSLATYDAQEAMIEFLQALPPAQRPRGVIHTFSGSLAHAEAYLDLGLSLSFSGVVTFKNAGPIAEAGRAVPSDRLLIETDCPFLAPVPHRGKRNEPAYVRLVAEKLAELRGVTVAVIDALSEQNTRHLFSLT